MSGLVQEIKGAAGVGEGELAELLTAFNAATGKLQAAHETLTAEVARLKGELAEANERLERGRRLAALGEMAAGIAHEVRNPLASIRLYATMLEEDLKDRERERTTAAKIGQSVRGLDAVVSDVLAFARELRVKTEHLEAGELFERAIGEAMAGKSLTQRRGDADGIKVEMRGAELEVESDRELMHRALVNVVRNAVEAMEGKGKLCVEAEEVEEEGVQAGRGTAVALRVRDTGPGVSPEVMARMFNPFFTTRATGTGLGLAIVHRIVDAHGGRVSVRNREGGGAEVEIVLKGKKREAGRER